MRLSPYWLVLLLCVGCGNDASGPIIGTGGTGGTGGVQPPAPDEDGDGISDEDEGRAATRAASDDSDSDGTPDYLDSDSDDDGISDEIEAGDDDPNTAPADSDSDGTPDFRDEDSDDNGRSDSVDGAADLDGDGIGNFADLDDDGDFLPDTSELGPDPLSPLDTDEDGAPDFQDTDSDNDTIKDSFEGLSDPDEDEKPSYLDEDADGDCVPDSAEAGDADLETPPIDTDGDRQLDFIDLDSDNDGLPDGVEDANCNGAVDPGESSPIDEDTDDDGVSDLIENAAGTDPGDPEDNPQENGDFVFVVPYEEDPDPTEDTLDFATDIVKADVVFGMDTTGSMGGEIANLKASITSLINTIRGDVPNTGFGVTGYEDFPTSPFGSAGAGDQPFYLLHRVMTTNTAAGLTSVEDAVDNYVTRSGWDSPESGWEMLYQVATGAGVTVGAASVPAFDPGTALPGGTPPTGEEFGALGGVGFRIGSLPIVVQITDACSHNFNNGATVDLPYSFSGAAESDDSIAALQALSARVIAVVSSDLRCSGTQALTHANKVVTDTGAVVPPEAWGSGAARPAGCDADECCTGINGAGQPPDSGGTCPLLFRVDGGGAGLGDAVATAVQVLAAYTLLDIGATPEDDPSDSVDAVAAFVQHIEANPTASAPCASGLTVIDANSDTIDDTFVDVLPGTTVCYDVVPKMNVTVPPLEEPQMFTAFIVVTGDGVTTLDTREIFFLVPPEIPDIIVE